MAFKKTTPPNHIYNYEITSMVRIPTKTRDALQELSDKRDLGESMGQLITILQRQESKKYEDDIKESN